MFLCNTSLIPWINWKNNALTSSAFHGVATSEAVRHSPEHPFALHPVLELTDRRVWNTDIMRYITSWKTLFVVFNPSLAIAMKKSSSLCWWTKKRVRLTVYCFVHERGEYGVTGKPGIQIFNTTYIAKSLFDISPRKETYSKYFLCYTKLYKKSRLQLTAIE